MTEDNTDECTGPDCPVCQKWMATEQARIMGGFAEALQKMLDDGYFYRLGRDMAMERNRRFWEVFMRGE